jgi:PAS domain S-box-containing protein
MLGIFRQFIRKRQVENELRKSEQRLNLAQLVASIGSWELDIDNKIIWGSDEAFKIYGLDLNPEHLLPLAFVQKIPLITERARLDAELLNLIKGNAPYDIEYCIHRVNDGKLRVVHSMARLMRNRSGKPNMVVGTIQDISGRRKAEESLRAEQEKLSKVAETVPGVICSFRQRPDGSVGMPYASPAVKDVYGLDPEIIAEDMTPVFSRIHPDDLVITYQSIELSANEMSPWHAEFRFDHPVKGEIWIEGRSMPVAEPDGGIIWHGFVMDITERKLAERKTHLLNTELEKRVRDRTAALEVANKELEAFAYSVSHDLRAPLRAIDGYTRILQEDFASQLNEEPIRLFSIIRENTVKMGQLIDDLLAFSRLGRSDLHFSPVDMNLLVDSVIQELTANSDTQQLDIQIPNLPEASGDLAMLRQVWTNLLSNAIKFSSKRENAVIIIRGERGAGENLYSVRDNGAGFNMKFAHKLFGVFERLHNVNEYKGTGVGLAIVQRIIHRHAGRVWAEGETGKGATFYFTLPAK